MIDVLVFSVLFLAVVLINGYTLSIMIKSGVFILIMAFGIQKVYHWLKYFQLLIHMSWPEFYPRKRKKSIYFKVIMYGDFQGPINSITVSQKLLSVQALRKLFFFKIQNYYTFRFRYNPIAALYDKGFIWLLKSGLLFKFDETNLRFDFNEPPRRVDEQFPGIPKNIRSAFTYNGKHHFFTAPDRKVYVFDTKTQRLEAGYPKPMATGWFACKEQ